MDFNSFRELFRTSTNKKSSVQNPIFVVAELHSDELGEGARDGFVFIAVRPAVAGQNIKIVFRNADALGELPLGQLLFHNDLIQSICKRHLVCSPLRS